MTPPASPALHDDVFTADAARLTRRHRAAAQRLFRGVYAQEWVVVTVWESARAACALLPDAVVSHTTAAGVRGWPVPCSALGAGPIHVTRAPERARSRRPGLRVHRAELAASDVTVVQGLLVTSEARTLRDLAALGLPHPDLVAVLDVLARRHGREWVRRVVAETSTGRGVRRLRRAACWCDPGADSPQESRVRLALHERGFTGLVHGVQVHDEHGQWVAAPDLADPVARVAVQYDGEVHADWRRRVSDIQRDELTRLAGWEVVVVTARDLHRPEALAFRVAAAYDRASRRRAVAG